MPDPKRIHRQVVRFALGLPGAYEDHPWEELVAKVGKKVFVFFGSPESSIGQGMTVKLVDSHESALAVPGAAPTRYGLGRSGWVDIPIRADGPPAAVLTDWVEESYRIVAPKRLIAELDAASRIRSPSSGHDRQET